MIESIIAENRKEGGETIYGEEKMIDEVGTFIFAGSDTTSNLLTFAIRAIYEHPHVLEKARQEVNEFIKSSSDFTQEKLKKMTYLEAVQLETNRMYGPVNGIIPRATT